MSQEENRLFMEMTEELLQRLGYETILRDSEDNAEIGLIKMCSVFKDGKNFLPIKYAPSGTSFVTPENHVPDIRDKLKSVQDQVEKANQSSSFQEETLMPHNIKNVDGALLVARVDETGEAVNYQDDKGVYLWGMHRIFFYTMKISTHSILENWVSESNLGFVIKEDEFKVPLESPFYGTVFVGLRYGQQSKKLEVYFSYFIDCLKNPHVVAKQTYSLTESHMEKILDDVYSRLTDSIITKLYTDQKMDLTVEIHAISGINTLVERQIHDTAKNYKNWNDVDVDQLTINEHTLFKYSVIPWESVMDTAYTKRTKRHTFDAEQIDERLKEIELQFANLVKDSIKKKLITEPFNHNKFENEIQDETQYDGKSPIYRVDCTRIPINQNLVLFSKSKITEKSPHSSANTYVLESLEKIVRQAQNDANYSYNWIALVSASGFSSDVKKYVEEEFNKSGVGLALIDAVTRKLYVNKNTDEGKKLNSLFLSICIS